MCIIYFWKLYFSKDFPKRDIKLFLIGGENEFSVLFKITYSILVFWIIQVILKGGEIVHKFYKSFNFSYLYLFQNTFKIIFTHVIYYVFLKLKEVNPTFKMFSIFRVHTLKNKGGETIFAYITFKSMFFIYIPLLRGTNCFWKFLFGKMKSNFLHELTFI